MAQCEQLLAFLNSGAVVGDAHHAASVSTSCIATSGEGAFGSASDVVGTSVQINLNFNLALMSVHAPPPQQQLGVKRMACTSHQDRLPSHAAQSALIIKAGYNQVQQRVHLSIEDSCNPVQHNLHCIIRRRRKGMLQQDGVMKL
nr:hypothetical protein CFP56_25115 [Quercus suber]